MFSATIILCAFINGGPDFNRCVALQDARGPYETVEDCNLRTREILDSVLKDPQVYILFAQRLMTQDVRGRGRCVEVEDDSIDA